MRAGTSREKKPRRKKKRERENEGGGREEGEETVANPRHGGCAAGPRPILGVSRGDGVALSVSLSHSLPALFPSYSLSLYSCFARRLVIYRALLGSRKGVMR